MYLGTSDDLQNPALLVVIVLHGIHVFQNIYYKFLLISPDQLQQQPEAQGEYLVFSEGPMH